MVRGYKGVQFQNWMKTYGCCPEMYYQPISVGEVREQVLALTQQQNKRVKVVGGGHSPSDIACTDGFMVHMGKTNRVLQVDKEKKQLLESLGLEHITRGSSMAILATQVVALTMMTAAGVILGCSKSSNADVFQAARVHLSCLGVILTGTLQCVPQFYLQETSFPSTRKEVRNNLEATWRCQNTSASSGLLTVRKNVSIIDQDHTNKGPSSPSNGFGDSAIGFYLLEFLPCLVGWINFLLFLFLFLFFFFFWLLLNCNLSHKIFTYECRFKQHVQDWAVPREKIQEALLELKTTPEAHPNVVAPCPVAVRFTGGDEILLNPSFPRGRCYMNILLYRPYGKDAPRLDYLRDRSEEVWRQAPLGKGPTIALWRKCTLPFESSVTSVRSWTPPGMFLNSYLEKAFY
ncbi:hypothetical protein STEG23_014105 [Scotinomys teguina]